ncbi:MAG TPA: acyl-CoA desaturase [Pyrinomonadaceae bacterium]|nr:acyl-CoA desaturase [Pyrinomonadaceae bacterium]
MTQTEHLLETPRRHHNRVKEITHRVKFGRDDTFYLEVKRRVEEFCETTGRRQRDCPAMYLKTAILLSSLVGFYVLLVFVATTWWQALPLALMLGFTTAGIGFNIQHDGSHQAYSDRQWINKLMAMTMDLIGASSYLWHWKHPVFHHTFANITGHDTDIDFGVLGRLTPHQKRLWAHRWQHFYLWPLYGVVTVKWKFFDDFKEVIRGRIAANHKIPRPKGWDLVTFLVGKAIFIGCIFVIPSFYHSIGTILLFYIMIEVVLGITLSVVFLLAHMVEPADFPLPVENTNRIVKPWAVHQVETAVDFSRHSRAAAWLLGGLNFQIEHHLFPRVCHTNYPAISKVVEQTCKEYGVKYGEHMTFMSGVISHFRFLRNLGRGTA